LPQSYDIAVVGAGVVGALTARELSRYDLRVALVERLHDVAQGTTKANSAIVHAGYDAKPGSWKARTNVRGSGMMPALCRTLHVPYERCGSLVVGFSEDEMPVLEGLLRRGEENGVPGLRLLGRDELLAMEPNVNPGAAGALYAPTGAIVCPYELCTAAAECAVREGVALLRDFDVTEIAQGPDGFTLRSAAGEVQAGAVVNAAGVHADDVARLVGDESFSIHARRGEYLLLDSARAGVVGRTVFQCPSEMGKGVLVTPTVHGNVLLGPTAEDVEDKYAFSTTGPGMKSIQEAVARTVPNFRVGDVITSFTGLRAHCDRDDFILEPSRVNPRFIHAAGVESPGLSAAPAIAEYAAGLAVQALGVSPAVKPGWDPGRPEPVRMNELDAGQRREKIRENPAYGRIICRCETVSEGEIVDAIRAPAGARDVDGVKRRTRAGMGRCQGGFCGTKVLEILSRELGLPPDAVTKFGGGSKILIEKTK
jgi:glycerol-3-phosphate dehydrogenase